MKSLLGIALVSSLIACAPTDRDGRGGGDDDDDGEPTDPIPGMAQHCNKMDIVFVIDDSSSMGEEQGNLATNFPMFADVLSSYTTPDGDHIDYRVAVTTTGRTTHVRTPLGTMTEVGDNGAFRNNCGVASRFLDPSAADLSATLSCRADVGVEGPATAEMPLMMSKWALSERVADGTNAGFLRDDALLAIVYLTDEDDLSTTADNFNIGSFPPQIPQPTWHPADQIQFLDSLKGDRSRWAASVIAGDGDCMSDLGNAADAKRMKQFVNLANANGTTQALFSSICAGDLASSLAETLATFQNACGSILL